MRDRKGFTLVEMLSVLLILLLLIGLLVYAGSKWLLDAQIEAAMAQTRALAQGCESYHGEYGYYPPMTYSPSSRNLHHYLGKARLENTSHPNDPSEPVTTVLKKPILEMFPEGWLLRPSSDPAVDPSEIVDIWGTPIEYRLTGTPATCEVVSAGPDRNMATTDDNLSIRER